MNEKINALFVYQDSKGRNVYYDFITKTYYLISNKDTSDFKKYNLRFIAAFIVFLIVFLFMGTKGIVFAFVAGIAVYAVMYLLFRFKVLPELIPLPSFERPHKENIIIQTAKDLDVSRILLVIVMTLLLIGMIAINIQFSEDINQITMYAYYVLYALMFIFLGIHVAALIVKITKKL